MKTWFLFLATFLAISTTNFANNPTPEEVIENPSPVSNWDKLGQKRIKLNLERDIVKAGLEGLFEAIKLKVMGNNVEFHRIVIKFKNGGSMEANIGRTIRAGQYSPEIALKGSNKRIIKEVVLYYERRNQGGQATVQVWGKHN